MQNSEITAFGQRSDMEAAYEALAAAAKLRMKLEFSDRTATAILPRCTVMVDVDLPIGADSADIAEKLLPAMCKAIARCAGIARNNW